MIPGDLLAIATETAPVGPTVYFLCWDDTVVYVGVSEKPLRRVERHRLAGRVFDRVLYLPCHRAWMEQAELMWVARLHPRHNKRGNPMPNERYPAWGSAGCDYPRVDDPPEAHEAYRANGVRGLLEYRTRVAVEELEQEKGRRVPA